MVPKATAHLDKDHVTDEDICRKIKAASRKYDKLLTCGPETETDVVWAHLKVFCLSKDNFAQHSERKKKY